MRGCVSKMKLLVGLVSKLSRGLIGFLKVFLLWLYLKFEGRCNNIRARYRGSEYEGSQYSGFYGGSSFAEAL